MSLGSTKIPREKKKPRNRGNILTKKLHSGTPKKAVFFSDFCSLRTVACTNCIGQGTENYLPPPPREQERNLQRETATPGKTKKTIPCPFFPPFFVFIKENLKLSMDCLSLPNSQCPWKKRANTKIIPICI